MVLLINLKPTTSAGVARLLPTFRPGSFFVLELRSQRHDILVQNYLYLSADRQEESLVETKVPST
jgi:hypothetical protein